jgi:hypothetical protein
MFLFSEKTENPETMGQQPQKQWKIQERIKGISMKIFFVLNLILFS